MPADSGHKLGFWKLRITREAILVTANFLIFKLAVLLISLRIDVRFSQSPGSLVGGLCVGTALFGLVLVFWSVGCSIHRRFVNPLRRWDFYGPSLGIIFWILIYWDIWRASTY